MTLKENDIKKVIEAALFAFGKPLTLDAIVNLFQDEDDIDKKIVTAALASIEDDCQTRGVELKKVSSGYRFQAKQDYAKWLQPLWQEKPPRYSRALLETMVLIAYKQPITRGEIEDVRGVSVSSHIVKTLQERDWIRVVGHRDVPGKPALFATTKGFLDYFNLSSLEQLPSLSQIKDLDKINEELEFSDGPPEASTTADTDINGQADVMEAGDDNVRDPALAEAATSAEDSSLDDGSLSADSLSAEAEGSLSAEGSSQSAEGSPQSAEGSQADPSEMAVIEEFLELAQEHADNSDDISQTESQFESDSHQEQNHEPMYTESQLDTESSVETAVEIDEAEIVISEPANSVD